MKELGLWDDCDRITALFSMLESARASDPVAYQNVRYNKLYVDASRKHLIPDKPRTVHLNFRSHCGILNVAAAVLSCLFEVFPDSAKQLKENRGLFQSRGVSQGRN